MLRKLAGVAGATAIGVLLTGVALAQMPMPSISLGGGEKKLSPEEQARKDAIDHAYNSAIQKIPEKKKTNDPWGNIRDPGPASSGNAEKNTTAKNTTVKNKQQ